MNANQCFISNVFLTYPFYIAAIIWPNLIWLGLAQVMLGMIGQSIAHIIVENIRLKTVYNPGVATVVFLHIPIGIYYVWYVTTNHLAGTGDFVFGFLGMIGAILVLFVLPIALMRDRTSEYPFSQAEMDRSVARDFAMTGNS